MATLSSRRKQQIGDILLANCCLVSTLLAGLAGAMLLSSFTSNAIAISTMSLLLGALSVTIVAVALHPEVTWVRLGLGRASLSGAAWGVAAGGAAVALLVLSAVWLQWAAWVPWDPAGIRFDWRDAPVLGLCLLAVGAAGEELFVRGPLLQFLARAVGPAGAVAATSLAFALLHGSNPGVTNLAQLNTALFGAVFGLAVLRKRSLWLAVGLHFGWNAAQVGLGANNSGITIRLTELNLELRGSEWLTGGGYGLEGGALATGMALLLGAVVWLAPIPGSPARSLWETGVPHETGPADPRSQPPLDVSAGSVDDGSRGQDREADRGATR